MSKEERREQAAIKLLEFIFLRLTKPEDDSVLERPHDGARWTGLFRDHPSEADWTVEGFIERLRGEDKAAWARVLRFSLDKYSEELEEINLFKSLLQISPFKDQTVIFADRVPHRIRFWRGDPEDLLFNLLNERFPEYHRDGDFLLSLPKIDWDKVETFCTE